MTDAFVESLDSKAEIAIHEHVPGEFSICVRGDYLENLGIHSFHRLSNKFSDYKTARQYVHKTYPHANIVAFILLTTGRDAE